MLTYFALADLEGSSIWRNGVLFTNFHSGHLGISMMDSNTTEYKENKNYFQIIQPLGIRKYFFLIWFCTLLNLELECASLLWAGTSRPIIWNKNLRSLCVSAGWLYNLSVYIYIFFNGQLIMHMILYFLCKEICWVFQHLLFLYFV